MLILYERKMIKTTNCNQSKIVLFLCMRVLRGKKGGKLIVVSDI